MTAIVVPDQTSAAALMAAHVADDATAAGKLHWQVSESMPSQYVSTTGLDTNTGRVERPKLTVAAAIAALTSGGVVKIGPGTFSSGTITLPSGIWLQGSGPGATTLRVANSTNSHLIKTASAATDIGVSNLKLDGNSANNTTTGFGVFMWSPSRFFIRDLFVTNTVSDGLYLGGGAGTVGPTQDGVVDNVTIDTTGRVGFTITSARRVTIGRLTVTNPTTIGIDCEPNTSSDFLEEITFNSPTVINAVQAGISIGSVPTALSERAVSIISPRVLLVTGGPCIQLNANRVTVQGGYLTGCSGSNSYGIYCSADQIHGLKIIGVEIDTPTSAGMNISPGANHNVYDLLVKGCTIHHSGGSGIQASGLTRSRILGNTIYNNTTRGVLLQNAGTQFSLHNVVANNVLYDTGSTQTTGITSTGSSDYNVVVGNSVENASVNPILLAGANNVNADNVTA